MVIQHCNGIVTKPNTELKLVFIFLTKTNKQKYKQVIVADTQELFSEPELVFWPQLSSLRLQKPSSRMGAAAAAGPLWDPCRNQPIKCLRTEDRFLNVRKLRRVHRRVLSAALGFANTKMFFFPFFFISDPDALCLSLSEFRVAVV